MSDIALTVSLLALVAVLGLWIGNWRIYGVGLGIGGRAFLAELSSAILLRRTHSTSTAICCTSSKNSA